MFDLVSDLLARFLSARRMIDLTTTVGLQRERHNGSQMVTVTWLVTARGLFVFCLCFLFPAPSGACTLPVLHLLVWSRISYVGFGESFARMT